jgi:hypothetical protein
VSDAFEVYLGRVKVAVSGSDATVLRGLRASLGACRQLVEPDRQVSLVIEPGRATLDGELISDATAPECALPLIEGTLYKALPSWHPGTWILHAAALSVRGKPVLLLGESGGGKSTLARDVLERGQDYFSDELAFYDGERLWGLPRAIQFDPVPVHGAQAQGVLRGCDLTTYTFWDETQQTLALPLWPVPEGRLATAPLPVEGAKLVFVQRAASTSMHPLEPAAALARLHASAVGAPREEPASLGSLVERTACWELSWDRGQRAWGHLRALLGI